MTSALDPAALAAEIRQLPVTLSTDGKLVIRTGSASFLDAVGLIDAVAGIAEEMNHHPDIDLRYDRVTFRLITHSAGAVTDLDFELARRILAVAATEGATVLSTDDQSPR
jgi:4a-hydroxytetrahydrobiopterin dehydratase